MGESEGTSASNAGSQKPRARRLTLPRGVLVRVDVIVDDRGEIQAFTRERLLGRWGEQRSAAATLVVQTGLDILNRFEAEEKEGRDEETPGRPRVTTEIATPTRLHDPEVQRLYA